MDPIAWEFIAPMFISTVFMLTIGGVILLRPIAKRIGLLLEVYAKEHESGLQGEVGQLRDLMETMNARLQLLEERQDFTERLLSSGERRALPLDRVSGDRAPGDQRP